MNNKNKNLDSDGGSDSDNKKPPRTISVRDASSQADRLSSKKKFSVKRIAEIYEDGGKVPDMSKIIKQDPHRRRKIFFVVIFFLVVLFGASLTGFYFFNESQNRFSGDRIELTVRGNEVVTSGDEMQLTITIKNGENIALTNGELTALYPTNFRFDSSIPQPVNERNNVWDLSTLPAGNDVSIVIDGSVIGEVGNDKVFAFTYTYIPENFNSEFEESLNFTVSVGSSILEVDLEAPIRVGVGKETEFTITYRNESDDPLERIRITATYPDGFSVISSTPEAKEGTNVWEISSLGSGEEGTIMIRGTLTGTGGETQELQVQAGLLESDNTFRLQVERTALILLLEPELSLTLTVDGSESGGVTSLGDLLSYTIAYVNNGDVEVKDVTIAVVLESDVLDWDNLIDPQAGLFVEEALTWTSEQVAGLESVKPNEGSELTFSVPILRSPYDTQDLNKNISVTAKATATSTKVTDLEGDEFVTDSNTTVSKVATDMSFLAEARFYSDENLKVGQGPLPPVVGQKTTFRIYWYLSNTSNEVTNVVVKATLPENTTWTGTTSVSTGEQLEYDKSTKTVTWVINRIPVGAGILFSELEAFFDVTVLPHETDVGNILLLSDASTATGTDAYTEEVITSTQDLLTSELDTDPQATGQGIVEAAE